jgi:RNA polymerase sigma-70 factor (ECF subfamily)
VTQAEQNQAFLMLFLRTEPRIYSYIRALVFNDADADELLQETAADLWRKFDEYDPATGDSGFTAWALSFARHKVLNYQRQRCRTGSLVFSEAVMHKLADRAAAQADQLHDTVSALQHCLEKLPAADRDLIHQRYLPGATNRSIAQSTGRSESQISRTLTRIYAALLQCIRNAMETGRYKITSP